MKRAILLIPLVISVNIAAQSDPGIIPGTPEPAAEAVELLHELAEGKLIAPGEVGKMPSPEILATQPDWVWFMTWVDFVFDANPCEDLITLYKSERILNRENLR